MIEYIYIYLYILGFRELGPQCAKLKQFLRNVKTCSVRTAMLSTDLEASSRHAVDSGVEAVVYTFFCWYLLKEIPEALNYVTVKKHIDDIRFQAGTKHKVPLTTQMEDLLKALESEETKPCDVKLRYFPPAVPGDRVPIAGGEPAPPAVQAIADKAPHKAPPADAELDGEAADVEDDDAEEFRVSS